MSRATPKTRDFAKRLIACETNGNGPAGKRTPAAFRVCAKLDSHLSTLMGHAGFRALLARSLALAATEVHWLGAVKVKANGSLDGLAELALLVDPNEFAEGAVVLVAQLLGLLADFIGEDLTLHLVRDVWPDLPLDALEITKEINNEKS